MSLRVTVLLLLALSLVSCARKDPTVEGLLGSEPQRLSFGPPEQVLPGFVTKMKLCWFSGSGALLSGYRFETGERQPDSGDTTHAASDGYENIKIYAQASEAEIFEVQFHKYNDNTLIVTRNVSLPDDLMAKVKRDIQLWALTGPDCNGL